MSSYFINNAGNVSASIIPIIRRINFPITFPKYNFIPSLIFISPPSIIITYFLKIVLTLF